MRIYAENEVGAAELEYEQRPMPEKHFKALCRVAYTAIFTAGEVAGLYLVGKIALVALLPAFLIALIAVLMEDG